MKINDALSIDRRKMAKAKVPLGYLYAMASADGEEVFVQFVPRGEKPMIRKYRLLKKEPVGLHKLYLSASWEPTDPLSPLEALARQAEEENGAES